MVSEVAEDVQIRYWFKMREMDGFVCGIYQFAEST